MQIDLVPVKAQPALATRNDYIEDYMSHLESQELFSLMAGYEKWRIEKAAVDKQWAAEHKKRQADHAVRDIAFAMKMTGEIFLGGGEEVAMEELDEDTDEIKME